ncbi:MAG TPA: ABC transporter ATP-binding protein [Nevskiaceae bacterium]
MAYSATMQDTVATAGLRVHGVCKCFDRVPVLAGIELDVRRGEIITVLGASGSGKTTLLRLICGFERVDCGTIELDGRVVADDENVHLPPERRKVGYVAQEGALFPHLDVAQNILFGLPRHLRRARRAERLARVHRLLELMELPADFASRMPGELSGGQQQRVALARALAPDPTVVLLDEPFSALDAGLRADTRTAVVASLRRVHATALLVTHDQDEALSLGDRVAVLQGGHLVQVAAPQDVYRFPASPEVARFVGDAVFVPGTMAGDRVECRFGQLPVARRPGHPATETSGQVQVLVRPEQFHLKLGAEGTAAGSKSCRARVDGLSFYGHDARVALRDDADSRFVASISGLHLPTVGDTVDFRIVGPVVVYPQDAVA